MAHPRRSAELSTVNCEPSATLAVMSEAVSGLGKKLLAAAVLVVAAYLVFKLVIGLVASVVWFLVAVVAVLAVIWAVRTL